MVFCYATHKLINMDAESLTPSLSQCTPAHFLSELLQKLYESIHNEPFKIPEDDGNDLTHTFFNPDREGWLLKLGN